MGARFSRIAKRFLPKSKVRILMVGLDGSGKTTILYKLKLGDVVTTVPTIGFNLETVEYKGINFTVWDIGGQEKIRKLWRHYFQNAQGLIFVVDSSDIERISEARNELHRILTDNELEGACVLVFANKQDSRYALPVGEVANKLGLHSLTKRCCSGLYKELQQSLDKAYTKDLNGYPQQSLTNLNGLLRFIVSRVIQVRGSSYEVQGFSFEKLRI